MIPGAELLLEICSENAQAALITNGFAQTQAVKVTHTGIADKIQFMITSEDAGFAKPDVRIFQSALQRAGVEKDAAIYIGDTFDTDIKGGMAAGLRVLWFNPQGLPLDPEVAESPLFLGEFRSLIELIAFLGEKWTWE
jgi:putative hydrolase of the HAD superfamily